MGTPELPETGKAVRFERYGGIAELFVVDVPVEAPPAGEVLVRVLAAGTNPGEAAIRKGLLDAIFPTTFPSGEGSDFAGEIVAVGDGVTSFRVGDAVLGWSNRRNSQAEYVSVPAGQVIPKPKALSWDVAGSLYVVGVTAYAAVRAVKLSPGDTLVVSAAAGGVGSVVVQMAKAKGATVIGIASESNHDWLREHGVIPVSYGKGLEARIRQVAPQGVDAFIDTFGAEYVKLALDLGVPKARIDTIIAFEAAEKTGVKTDGSSVASTPEILADVAELVANGTVEIPIAARYPLDRVRDAYTKLEKRHTHGKIVLLP
ncbi:hypothetical protein AKJ09_09307 [Labilithrix luteola]|uniref:Enoyl reductase (ER) domain-containing protein n=1 Tax=Labilithrix luteola TaxID=1391654 RepID=A0A0K1QA76_9BACT|nr:NADP-dependent oxidoreductase [Labilithrix luteola]AKV02644.1 hypothetical protein AKJ09_09307 [Labilithrix luteola]